MGEPGRPVEYTEERIAEICKAMEEYTENTDIPIVAEFAYKHNIRRSTLYEYAGFSYALKRMIDKKEAQLEKRALQGEVNSPMAIFSLKQLGWSDRQDLNIGGQENSEPVKIKWE